MDQALYQKLFAADLNFIQRIFQMEKKLAVYRRLA